MEKRKCYVCEKSLSNKNEIGLNKKLYGRKLAKFYCYDCLAEQLEIEVDELFDKIDDFKSQGCLLFD